MTWFTDWIAMWDAEGFFHWAAMWDAEGFFHWAVGCAAISGLLVAIWRSVIASRTLLNERYQRGASMLGSSVLAERLGGIYALDKLAKDNPRAYHIPIMDLFSAFVCRPPDDPGHKKISNPWTPPALRKDVQDVMRCIGGRNRKQQGVEKDVFYNLDLRHADLSGLESPDRKFRKMHYWLAKSFPPGKKFINEMFGLFSFTLAGATLTRRLQWLYPLLSFTLAGATLTQASLRNAKLPYTDLSSANLNDVDLSDANLKGANLKKADLRNVDLYDANLEGANLEKADLRNANITKVKLLGTIKLTQGQLNEALVHPKHPPELSDAKDSKTGKQLVWDPDENRSEAWRKSYWAKKYPDKDM